jgi:hypothetical protein
LRIRRRLGRVRKAPRSVHAVYAGWFINTEKS